MDASIIFDEILLKRCDFDKDIKKYFSPWIKTKSTTEKREIAPYVIENIVRTILFKLNANIDDVKLNNICKNIKYFEDLIIGAKSGLANKFYRDHLNHMIRTFLIYRILLNHIKESFNIKNVDTYGIEALLHDICYPIEASKDIFFSLTSGLEDSYSDRYYSKNIKLHMEPLNLIRFLFDLKLVDAAENINDILIEIFKYNHALVGAHELNNLLSFSLKNKAIKNDICSAIAFHDPRINTSIDIDNNIRAALLVMADEIQEWGRPAGYETDSVTKVIELTLKRDGIITVKIDWDQEGTLFSFSRLSDKIENFKRLKPTDNFKFNYTIILPKYRKISKLFEEIEEFSRINFNAIYENYSKKNHFKLEISDTVDIFIEDNYSELIFSNMKIPENATIVCDPHGWHMMNETGVNFGCTREINLVNNDVLELLWDKVKIYNKLLNVMKEASFSRRNKNIIFNNIENLHKNLIKIEILLNQEDFVTVSYDR